MLTDEAPEGGRRLGALTDDGDRVVDLSPIAIDAITLLGGGRGRPSILWTRARGKSFGTAWWFFPTPTPCCET